MKTNRIIKIDIISKNKTERTCIVQLWSSEKYSIVSKLTLKELKEICDKNGIKINE